MKIIGSGLFIIIGIVTGVLVHHMLGNKSTGVVPNVILGIIGAFAGLFFKDIFDIQLLGNLGGAALFSFIGALLILVPVNLLLNAANSD